MTFTRTYDKTELVLNSVHDERRRQEKLKAEGRFRYTCADPEMTDDESYVVLGEEFGEVAKQVLTQPGRTGEMSFDTVGTSADLRKELIQVAAIAVAWVERIDNGK